MSDDDNRDNSKDAGDDGLDNIIWDVVEDDIKTSEEKKNSDEFKEFKKSGVKPDAGNLGFIMDIPLEVTVELGRTKMPIFDLLQLSQGSIVELSKAAGDSLDILVNNKLIARGEVVVVDEKFGIRLTDVVSTKERIENLK